MKLLIDKMHAKFINMTMMSKLILMLSVGILPLLSTTIYAYTNTKEILIDQTYQSVENMNMQISANINKHLETYMQISSFLYTDTNLKSYLTKIYEEDYDFVTAYGYINRVMYSLMVANSSIKSIHLYTQNLTIPVDGTFIYHITANDDTINWLTSSSSYGNILYKGTYVNSKGERVFALGRELNFNNQNYAYAYLVVEVMEDVLYSLIAQESLQKDIYITDENGIIISTKDKEQLSKNLEELLGTGIFSGSNHIQQTVNVRKDKVMIVYNEMINGWRTVTVVPLNTILTDAAKASNRVAFISFLCIITSVSILILISRYFSHRLKVLNRQVSMIIDNNYSYQAKITSTDEMGQLSASMNIMARKLDEAINEAYTKEIERRRAEFNLLQSQINPHFLYNTLSGISSLAFRSDNKEVGTLINHLSQFYKISLNQGKEYISIDEEIKLTKHYVALQEMRFKDMFRFHWNIEESVCEYQTLKLLLQPFIENSVNHGIREDSQPLNIYIYIYQSEGMAIFEVEDDGVGISEGVIQSKGYGISNVNNRIKLSYGEMYGVSMASIIGHGTKVTIRIPLICRESGNNTV